MEAWVLVPFMGAAWDLAACRARRNRIPHTMPGYPLIRACRHWSKDLMHLRISRVTMFFSFSSFGVEIDSFFECFLAEIVFLHLSFTELPLSAEPFPSFFSSTRISKFLLYV